MNVINILLTLDSFGFSILRILLSVLWQSTIILAAAGALAWFLKKRGARVCHIIWTVAVCLIPILPLLNWGAASLGSPRAEIQVFQPYTAPVTHQLKNFTSNMPLSVPEQSAQDKIRSQTDVHSPNSLLSIPDCPWALGLAGYLFLVFSLLFWIAVGRLRIRRWILNGEAVIDPCVLDTFREAGLRLGLKLEYPVIEHEAVPAPVACRIFHPVIIMPSGFAADLNEAELRAVAFHELTHIRRRDTLVFAMISLIRAVFFFQPLVWFACRRISYLAELTCDNAVLDSQGDPAAYAEFLTRIASRLPDRALSTELAAGILFSNGSFFLRIKEILSDRHDQVKKLSRLAFAGLLCAGMLSLVIAASMPIGEKSSRAQAWETYLQNPYSVPALTHYLQKTGNTARWIIGDNIIGGVYCANHNGAPTLYIVELASKESGYPHTYSGTLMAFDADGKFLKAWDREGIEKSAIDSNKIDISDKIKAHEIIDLPDMNGDAFSEIPTYRVSLAEKIGGTLIVYRTNGNKLSCIFAVESLRNIPYEYGNTFGQIFLERKPERQGLILEMQPFAVAKTDTLRKGKDTPPKSIIVNIKPDLNRYPDVLAEFTWSESQQTFIGPEPGSGDDWKLLDAAGRENISITMTAPKSPGTFKKIKSLVPSLWKKKTAEGDATVSQNDDTSKTVTLSGRVVSEGKPVSGAEIYIPHQDNNGLITGQAEKATVSGRDGSFKFEKPKQKYGLPYLFATYKGYSFGWVNFFQNPDEKNITISLYKPGIIKGTVYNEKGKPLKDAEITVEKISLSAGRGVYNTFISGSIPGTLVKTDEKGNFIIKNLPPNVKYDLIVKAPGYAKEIKKDINTGTENIDFSLVPEGRIEGRIMLGDTGKPASHLFFSAAGQYVSTDENGSFSVGNLKAGEHIIHRLEVSPEEENFDWTMEPLKINVETGKTSHVDLKMIKGIVITGKVSNKDNGLPLSRIRLMVRTSKYFMSVPKETDSQGMYKVRYPGGIATISVSSEYNPVTDKFDPINRNPDTVTEKQVNGNEGDTISGINFSIDSRRTNDSVIVSNKDQGISLQFIGLSQKNQNTNAQQISVSGKVTFQGKPVPGALIFLYHSDLKKPVQSGLMATSKNDGDFTFEVDNSLFGYWNYVFVTHPKYSFGWGILKPENKNKPLNIILYNPSSISGRIVDKDMKPIEGVSIRMPIIIMSDVTQEKNILTELMGTSNIFLYSYTTRTDENGFFIFKNLPKDSKAFADLFASKSGYAPYSGHNAPMGSNLSIVLRPEGRISGKVTYKNSGLPARNVEILAGGFENIGGNSAVTDKEGNYKIHELSSGWYDVLYGPSLPLDWTAAAIESVNVEEGRETKNVNIKLIKGGIISGKVIDTKTGKGIKPNEHSEVSIYGPSRPMNLGTIQSAPVQPDGSYRIRVAPGKNYIYLQTFSGKMKEKHQFHWVDKREGQTVRNINFYVNSDSLKIQNQSFKPGSLKSMKEEMIEKEAVVLSDEKTVNEMLLNIRISQAWGRQLRPPDNLKRAIFNLAEAVNRYTNIDAKVDNHLSVDSQKIFDSPFVYIASDDVFKLTETEAGNLGKYLRKGGFAFIDNCASLDSLSKVEESLKQMVRDSLGSDDKFSIITDNHPLFHCFFDFNEGPPEGDENRLIREESTRQGKSKIIYRTTVYKLEGVWIGDRLAVIYSNNGYAQRWNEMTSNDPQLKFGVNLVVYALQQENGIGYKKFLKPKQ
jgi:beta-lactamase regulating signal transducer with metallopeptidase domain/protocatechuate 3,4-dioxygenase beta subunit